MDFLDGILMRLKEDFEGDSSDIGEELFPDKYVNNDPRRPREEVVFVNTSEDYLESRRIREIEALRKRSENFSKGINVLDDVQRVDLKKILFAANNWNYFPLPSKTQLVSLMSSIENIGMVNPIILMKEDKGKYTIIDGRSRFIALLCLCEIKSSEEYRYPVCYVLDPKKVDEYYIRTLMIDLNFKYRDIPQNVFVRMLYERFEILRRSKQFRSEYNIAEQLAEEFMMSTSSVYNYLALRKLSEEVMTLVLDKRMNLQIARLFVKLDHEDQRLVLENIDFKEINCYHKMKYIVSEDIKSKGAKREEEVKRRVSSARDMVPENVSFTVKLNKKLIVKFSDQLVELLKHAAMQFSTAVAKGSVRKYCKISYDQKQMQYLVKGNYVDEKTLERLGARTLTEVFRK